MAEQKPTNSSIQDILKNGSGAINPDKMNGAQINGDIKINSLFNQTNPQTKNYYNPDDKKNISDINFDFKKRAKGICRGGAAIATAPAFAATSLLCFFFFACFKASQLAIKSDTDLDKAVDYTGEWFLNNSKNILGLNFNQAQQSLSEFIFAKDPEHGFTQQSEYKYESTGDGVVSGQSNKKILDNAAEVSLSDLELQAREQAQGRG
jgi:hypothetical protein